MHQPIHTPHRQSTQRPTRPASGIHKFPRQSSHHKPIHQRHACRASPHKCMPRKLPQIHTPTDARRRTGPRRRCRRIDVDADTQTLLQHRCNRRPDAVAAPCQFAIGQARQTGSDQTKLDQVRPDRTRPDQVSDMPSTEPDGTGSGHDLTGRVPDRTRTGSVRQQLNRPGIRQAII